VSVPASSPFISYSANHEDVFLNRLFGKWATGFYVDVGAAHPVFENDTKALYDRGWRGINIEPNARFFRELVTQRPCDRNLNVAVSDLPGQLTYNEVIGTGLSTCDLEGAQRAAARGFQVVPQTVEATTLRHILEEAQAPAVDLLKVDVEGFELKVLSSNDWSRFRPKLILAEATFPESPVRRPEEVTPYLAAHGYRHVYFDGLNDYYVEENFEIPADVFDRPPNIFDNVVLMTQQQAVDERNALALEVDSVKRELNNLHQERENSEPHLAALRRRIDDLRQERDDVKREHENARLRIAQLAMQIKDHARLLAATEKQLREARDNAADYAADFARAREEMIVMRGRNAALAGQLQDELNRRDAELHALKTTVHQLYTSTSWRITRPLRALARPRRTLRILLGRWPN
jgi:FkbM family methyltransferase